MSVSQKWAELSRYDLDTAKAMLATGRYLYVLFCCQQAVEKAIKGIVASATGEMPPRLHNLMSLAQKAGLVLGERRAEQLRTLTGYYIQFRYSEEIGKLAADVDVCLAEEVLQLTEELLKWLSESMK